MWNVIANLSPSTFVPVGILAVLGLSIRPIFKYPHIWRYLEFRHRSRHSEGKRAKKDGVR